MYTNQIERSNLQDTPTEWTTFGEALFQICQQYVTPERSKASRGGRKEALANFYFTPALVQELRYSQ